MLRFIIVVGLIELCLHMFYRGRHKTAIMMLAPAILGIFAVIVYPFLFQLYLSVTNLNLFTIGGWLSGESLDFVGFRNFVKVFTSSPLQTVGFFELLIRTLLWTVINVFFHVCFGLGLALLLKNTFRGRGLVRTLLIIPWALPQVIVVLALRGEFHPQFGVFNHLLKVVGFTPVNWWSDPLPVFISCCLVNIYLGIPFMMIVFLGGLQSISPSYYEAASIDGASRWQQFKEITLPLLRPVVVPSVTLGTIWTFNNINVIYLMTGQGGGNEFADILISAWYKSAFNYTRYSYAAAFAVVIFLILLAMSLLWIKLSGGVDDHES